MGLLISARVVERKFVGVGTCVLAGVVTIEEAGDVVIWVRVVVSGFSGSDALPPIAGAGLVDWTQTWRRGVEKALA